MIVRIKRQDGPGAEPYIQSFEYSGSGRLNVACILEELSNREELIDTEGRRAGAIRWECSCRQKLCGACAMVINGRPSLACSEFVDADKDAELMLEPLKKFPVIKDLSVDRSSIAEHQKLAMMYLGERGKLVKTEHQYQYSVAKCLKCGLCLEVCPNYVGPEGNFYGAVLANEAYLLHSSTQSRKKEIAKQYRLHFGRGCSKALLCRDICPAKIPTLASIGYMNRK